MIQNGRSRDVELYLIDLLNERKGDVWRAMASLPEDTDINSLLAEDPSLGIINIHEVTRRRESPVHEKISVGVNCFTANGWGRMKGRAEVWDVATLLSSRVVTKTGSPVAVYSYDDSNDFIKVANTTIRGEQYYGLFTYVGQLDIVEVEC